MPKQSSDLDWGDSRYQLKLAQVLSAQYRVNHRTSFESQSHSRSVFESSEPRCQQSPSSPSTFQYNSDPWYIHGFLFHSAVCKVCGWSSSRCPASPTPSLRSLVDPRWKSLFRILSPFELGTRGLLAWSGNYLNCSASLYSGSESHPSQEPNRIPCCFNRQANMVLPF